MTNLLDEVKRALEGARHSLDILMGDTDPDEPNDHVRAMQNVCSALAALEAVTGEEMVEKVAKRICLADNGGDDIRNHGATATAWLVSAERYRKLARAALAAMGVK